MSSDLVSKREWQARSIAFDIAVASICTAISIGFTLSLVGDAAGDRPGRALTLVLVLLVVHGMSLVLRRVQPLMALSGVIASGVTVILLGWPSVVLGVAVLVAVYSIGAELPSRTSVAALAVTIFAALVAEAATAHPSGVSTIVGNVFVLCGGWFLGTTVRSRRQYAQDLERRNAELEAAHQELAEKAVAEERVRIARELHDVIAHSMSLIAVQAGVGRTVAEADPEEAKRSLETIETTSRSALVEVRRVLGLLRGEGSGAERTPAPSLNQLGDLVEQVSRSGIAVQVQSMDDLSDLPAGLQLTIYRVVQEALTNAVKHSGASHSRVVLARGDRDIRVDVVDDGGSQGPIVEGTGLRGMRERLDAYGGTLDVRRLPQGGFRISAIVPLEVRT